LYLNVSIQSLAAIRSKPSNDCLELRFDFNQNAIRPRYDQSTTGVTTVGLPVCGLRHWGMNE